MMEPDAPTSVKVELRDIPMELAGALWAIYCPEKTVEVKLAKSAAEHIRKELRDYHEAEIARMRAAIDNCEIRLLRGLGYPIAPGVKCGD
jgi:hypothetical protein